jgi:hypothetical protein
VDERSAEEFREFMHGRWPSMVRWQTYDAAAGRESGSGRSGL